MSSLHPSKSYGDRRKYRIDADDQLLGKDFMIPSNFDAGPTVAMARREGVRFPPIPQVVFVVVLVIAGLFLGVYRGTVTRRKTPSQHYPAVNRFCRTYLKVLREEGITGAENRQLMANLSPFVRANVQDAAESLVKVDLSSLVFVRLVRQGKPGGGLADESEQPARATYQVKIGDAWHGVELELDSWRKPTQLRSVTIEPLTIDAKSRHAFRLEGKPLGNFVILGIAIIVPLFSIYVAILCLFQPVDTRLWAQYAWLIFIMFGIGHLSINWTTGQLSARPAAIRFPVARIFRPDGFSAWYLTISCPVGALLYLRKRQSHRLQRAKELAARGMSSPATPEAVSAGLGTHEPSPPNPGN